jgi:hypothetical protein
VTVPSGAISTLPIGLHGTPAATELAGMLRFTTDPAAITD